MEAQAKKHVESKTPDGYLEQDLEHLLQKLRIQSAGQGDGDVCEIQPRILREYCDTLNHLLIRITQNNKHYSADADPALYLLYSVHESLCRQIPVVIPPVELELLPDVEFQTFSDCCLNIILFLNRLSSSGDRGNSLFQMMILTLQKLWKFAKQYNSGAACSVSEHVLKDLNQSNAIFKPDLEASPKLLMLLRCILDSIKEEQTEEIDAFLATFLNWIHSNYSSTKNPSALTLYIQYVSPENQISLVTEFPDIIPQLRHSLLSSNQIERKQALFILKSLTSSLAGNYSIFSNSAQARNELMADLSDNLFLKFWSDFFELFEILDETQIHIIEPFLLKLDKLQDLCSSSVSFIFWYFVILKKMIQHENRSIVEKSILDFFKARHLMSPSTREMFFDFITTSVLPAVRKNVGWIFPEAKNFFSASVEMGILLHEKYDSDILSLIELILGFIEGCGNSMSPLSIFFLIECVRSSMSLLKDTKVSESDFMKSVLIVNGILMKCLTTVDKYIGSQIQKSIVNIFCGLCDMTLLGNTVQLVREFLGLLVRETVVFHVAKLSKTLSSEFSSHFELQNEVELSSNQKMGYFRILFVIYSDTSDEKSVLEDFPYQALLRDTSVLAGSSIEFLRCILLAGTPKEQIWITVMTNSMTECLNYWYSDVHKNSEIRSSEVLEIQELILTFFNDSVPPIELAIANYQLCLRHHLKPILGESIYSDYETLRLMNTTTGLQNKYKAMIPRFYPCLFTFEDTFMQTRLMNYGKISPKPETSFLSEFYEVRMKAFTVILQYQEIDGSVSRLTVEIMDSILDEVDMSGPTGINCAMEFFVKALSVLDMDEEKRRESIEKFVQISWGHVFEMRKTESFWIGLKNFVELICHPYFASSSILSQYGEEMFKKGELVTGIPMILVERLSRMDATDFNTSRVEQIIRIFVKASYFGNALHKSNRVTFSIFDYIGKLENEWNPTGPNIWNSTEFLFNADSKMRIMGILGIVQFQEMLGRSVIEYAVGQLLDANKAESRQHRIYFGNSVTHRIKQRISQTLLVLQSLFSEELAGQVTTGLLDSLTLDCPQPGVRYYMEWIIMKNLLKYSNLHNEFFDAIRQCCKKRTGIATFVCSICLHVSLKIKDVNVLQTFCDKALRLLTNFLTGQHLTVRVYAQICFARIYTKLAETLGPDSSMLAKFEIIQESLTSGSITSGGNYFKMVNAMKKDFWLEVFDPEIDYNPEAIFIYIPQATGMCYDEIIRKKDLAKVLRSFDLGNMRNLLNIDCCFESQDKYSSLKSDSFHLKPPVGDGREMSEVYPLPDSSKEDASEPEATSTLQRKINPWKVLPVSDEISDFPEELQMKKKALSEEGLIVVASLIDRIPNLGGLCRSCEIFGVSKYVISNFHLLEDPAFKSLSVTAHSWIDIVEVPAKDLESFLSLYSSKGYRILGIEQAIGSVSLNDYKFPKKSVLLLGNEKLGIPPHLLHLVDQCLEIPQVGVVRSLNVHVTGALCIWQYATQHIV